jgi:hypothetical protein
MVAGSISTPQTASGAAPVPHAAWAAARRDILEAFAAGEHLIALLGPDGVGKSLLLQDIENSLRSPEFHVQRLLGDEWTQGAPPAQVLLVDEADRLDDAALKQLAHRVTGFAVLVGRPGFAARLASLPHRVVELEPLRAAEIPAYVTLRLGRMGLERGRLSKGALTALAEQAGGVPGRLNLLIGASFLAADIAGAQEVEAEHVAEAAALRAEPPAGGPPARNAAPPFPERAPRAEPPPQPPRRETRPSGEPPSEGPPFRASEPSMPESQSPESQMPESQMPERLVGRGLPGSWNERIAAAAAILVIGAAIAWLVFPARPGGPGLPQTPDRPFTVTGRPAADDFTAPRPAWTDPEAADAAEAADAPPGGLAASGGAGGQQAASAPLPPGAMVRVVITYPRGTAEASQRATALSGELRGAGLSVGEPFPISRAPGEPAISYFFREDREAALRVQQLGATELGQAVPRLGPVGATLPRPGAIEVGLPAAAIARDERPEPAEEPDAPAPEAVTPANPPNGALLHTEAAQQGVTLSWRGPVEARRDCCFVEVVAVEGGGAPREVFAAYAEAPDQQVVRPSKPGLYAWRVLTVSRAARRYTASPWQHFMLGEAPS